MKPLTLAVFSLLVISSVQVHASDGTYVFQSDECGIQLHLPKGYFIPPDYSGHCDFNIYREKGPEQLQVVNFRIEARLSMPKWQQQTEDYESESLSSARSNFRCGKDKLSVYKFEQDGAPATKVSGPDCNPEFSKDLSFLSKLPPIHGIRAIYDVYLSGSQDGPITKRAHFAFFDYEDSPRTREIFQSLKVSKLTPLNPSQRDQQLRHFYDAMDRYFDARAPKDKEGLQEGKAIMASALSEQRAVALSAAQRPGTVMPAPRSGSPEKPITLPLNGEPLSRVLVITFEGDHKNWFLASFEYKAGACGSEMVLYPREGEKSQRRFEYGCYQGENYRPQGTVTFEERVGKWKLAKVEPGKFDPKAYWKTLSNTADGFQITYPEWLEAYVVEGGPEDTPENSGIVDWNGPFHLQLSVDKQATFQKEFSWALVDRTEAKISERDFTLNGDPAHELFWENQYSRYQMMLYKRIAVHHDGNTYWLNFDESVDGDHLERVKAASYWQHQDIIERMLGSLKFSN